MKRALSLAPHCWTALWSRSDQLSLQLMFWCWGRKWSLTEQLWCGVVLQLCCVCSSQSSLPQMVTWSLPLTQYLTSLHFLVHPRSPSRVSVVRERSLSVPRSVQTWLCDCSLPWRGPAASQLWSPLPPLWLTELHWELRVDNTDIAALLYTADNIPRHQHTIYNTSPDY